MQSAITRGVLWGAGSVIVVYLAFLIRAVLSARANTAFGIGIFFRILYTPSFWAVALLAFALVFLLAARFETG